MKNWIGFLVLLFTLAFVGCNPAAQKTENKKPTTKLPISFADFKKIKGVDNVQEVPFQLFSKLDSVRFYLAPDKDSAFIKIPYSKLDNYYGFEEFDDFYAIHYSIENNLSNSIEAFVLKTEFTASVDLSLKGINLYEIRSSIYMETPDLDNKSFTQYGTIEEVTADEYRSALPSKTEEVFSKNPHVKLKDNEWIYSKDGQEQRIQQHENLETEDGVLSYHYIGRSDFLNLEIFKEDNLDLNNSYHVFYNPQSAFSMDLFTAGYPHIIPSINRVSAVSNNNDVGVDFLVAQYLPEQKALINQLYVNFTKFKFSDETKGFWINHDTFYAEVYPSNSAPENGKKQKLSYIKIQLKSSLFN